MGIIKQAIRYGLVGVGNTLITAAVIWVMMKIFDVSDILSNITGYIAGLVNSFIWNRQWTFKSSVGWTSGALKFGSVFVICYLLQLGVLLYLNKTLTIDSYYNQLIAMAFYTVINFVMNKFYTFKS
ncbi:GtrA family protein [Massilibacteroides vaginae]|uniref:GtrA family protein n=1 Tax=Massilibacteroides vaginae TaxID=1673718 RepID=UPI000A1CDF06|nr:GtrA family protein [Massilibacteroides vaginae]